MSVPYIFASATTSLPLSQLDTNFSYFADAITVSSGNVGIGTSSPTVKLDIGGSTALAIQASLTSGPTDPNFHLYAVNGATGSAAGTEVARFGVGYDGNASTSFSSGFSFIRGGDATDGSLAILTNASERMRIDSSGNVGIGTSAPSGAFGGPVLAIYSPSSQPRIALKNAVSGNAGGDGFQIGLSGDTPPIAFLENREDGPMTFSTNGTERMRIDSSGNVGIGTSSPTYKLQLSTDSAAKPSTNTWTIASDERIKNVTGEYTKGLDAVCALRPITYEYNGAAGFEADGKENISIIAQEAIEHFPECVGTFNAKLNETDETETELYNWNGHALTFALVNAIKELKAELDTVKSELNALKNA